MTTPQELEEAYRDLIADLEAATGLAVEKPRKLSLARRTSCSPLRSSLRALAIGG